MAHSNNIISKININNTLYELHDAEAIHSLSDLGLTGVMQFKGVVTSQTDLPVSGSVGDVYHITDEDSEYIWTSNNEWEEFGSKFITDHKHNVSLSGSATVTGTNAASNVSGSATVTGTNAASSVSASGSVSVPKVSKEPTYLKVTSSVGNAAIGANGTATPITGFGTHTTAAAITALNTTTVKNPTVTAVSIPNVTGNTSVTASKISANTNVTASKVSATAGTAAAWSATVTDGVLSFSWTANTPTAVSASDVTASKITASDVTATNTTLGTALSASKVTTTDITVATGSKTTANAITALGTPTTATVLTGVKVTTQPTVTVALEEGTSTDGVYSGDLVAITSENKSVSVSGTAAAQTWTQGSGTISGTAAA